MQITWKFVDGTKSTVEVEEELGNFILQSRLQEESADHYERIHTYSLEQIIYEGKEYADPVSLEEHIENEKLAILIDQAWDSLTDVQSRRLEMLISGLSTYEIAELEGTAHQSVQDTVEAIRKKFKKIFLKYTC